MNKRERKLFLGTTCVLVSIIFASVFASIVLPQILNKDSISQNTLDSATININDICVTEATREIEMGKYGIVTVYDTFTLNNNGSDPLSYLYYTLANDLDDNINYIGAETEDGAELPVQESISKINGYKTYIVYLNTPLLPGLTQDITIISAFADIIEATGTTSTQVCAFTIDIIPTIPYEIETLTSTIIAPEGSTLGTYDPTGDASGTTGISYDRSEIDAFSSESVSGEYTYNTNPIVEIVSLNRRIDVNSWGFIKVTEILTLNNTGSLTVPTLYWTVPSDVQNISAYDGIGEISGISLADEANTDGNTKNVTFNLYESRSVMAGGTSVSFSVEYTLPLDNYFYKGLSTAGLKINLNLLKSEYMIKNQVTQVYLYAGSELLSTTITPDQTDFDDNSMVLVFEDENLVGYEKAYLFIEYKESIFQLTYRAFIFTIIIAVALTAYVVIKTIYRNREDIGEFREEVIPENEIREFITLYEEINAIRIDLKKLDFDVSKKKIAKKQYSKNKKMFEAKIKNTQMEIKEFKDILIATGGRFGAIVQKLDLHEAELIANQDGITLHDQRYKRGKLPSKKAYNTLREQMIKQGEKTQRQIDKLINELKTYLI